MPNDVDSGISLLLLLGEALVICFLFIGASILLSRVVFPRLHKRLNKTKHPVVVPILQGYRQPVSLLLKLLGGFIGVIFFFGNLPGGAPAWLTKTATWLLPFSYTAMRISIIVAVAWGLINSSRVYAIVAEKANNKLDLHVRKSMGRFLGAVFNVVVVAIAVVMILGELNYNANSLIAGLGLGGLTVALAAKDATANFFGGLILVTERPFEIGDWISCDGVEGTVEDITLRSTKIRTGPGSLTIVPNANISNAAITNWSGGMEKRRANFKLQFTYSTNRGNLQNYIDAVRTMLETDPEVVTDSIMVRFSDLAESGLGVTVRFFTVMPAYDAYMRVLERINFSLLALAQQYHVEFAFPTRTLYIRQEEPDSPEANTTQPKL